MSGGVNKPSGKQGEPTPTTGYIPDPAENDRFKQILRDKKEKQMDKNLIGFIAQT